MAEGGKTLVVGVDGCPGGWVAVAARNGRFEGLASHPDIESVVAAYPGAEVLGIDIALSFRSGSEPRLADTKAKQHLGRFSSSLFLTPPREVLVQRTYTAANELSRKKYRRGISAQSYALRKKILEVVEFTDRAGERRLHEVHPELSFRYLAKSLGQTISFGKRTWSGAVERYRLLDLVRIAPPLDARAGLGKASVDDVLDAAVAAWSAARIAKGAAEKIGQGSRPGSSLGIIFA